MATKEKFARRTKEHMVGEVKTRLESNPNFVLTNYMGSSVSDLELLRRNLTKAAGSYFVVKNSVLRVAFEELKLKEVSDMIDAGMGVSLCGDDMVLTCKELVDFAKTHNKFKIKVAYIDGKVVTMEKITAIASLPSRDILLARVVGGIKSPIAGFVNVLAGVIRKFVYCVDAIKVEKAKAAPAKAPAAPAAVEPAKETAAPAAVVDTKAAEPIKEEAQGAPDAAAKPGPSEIKPEADQK